MVRSAKHRAKKAGLPFDITIDDIVIPERCPLLDILIDRAVGRRTSGPNSPSLDRIIPSLGYVKDNVWVISQRANRIKYDATIAEIKMVAHNLERLEWK